MLKAILRVIVQVGIIITLWSLSHHSGLLFFYFMFLGFDFINRELPYNSLIARKFFIIRVLPFVSRGSANPIFYILYFYL